MNPLRSAAVALLLSCVATVAAAADGQLIEAVKHQDVKTVQAVLKRGVDVNASQPDGATALHWSVYLDDLPTVDLLVRAGANVNVANQLGVTPLMLASENRNPAMVERLLKAGADPNAGPKGGETPVMTAARVGSAEVMTLLLARGGDANAKEAFQGQTALMWAASGRHADVVRMLVEKGADVRARTRIPPPRRGGYRRAPDAAAAATGAGDDAVAVANGMAPPAGRGNGFTPLLFAARVGDIESGRILRQAGADVNDTSADGMSALILATVRGNPAFAMFLLDQGANPNADGAGYTALHWAAGTWESELTVRAITTERDGEWSTVAGLKEGKLELVKALLAHGADPNARMKRAPARAGSSKNPALPELEGATPLLLAAMAGDAAVMQALVTAGADTRLVTKINGTLLMAAAGLGHVQGEDFVRETDALAAAKLALELGADPNAADSAGNTALHYAGYMRHDSIVQLLADRGVPLDVKNKFGETPLWTAELVVQFMGGGTFQLLPSAAADLLRKLGAQSVEPTYTRARPTDWPDNPRTAGDDVEAPVKPKDVSTPPTVRDR
jgi:ankyrin repeat protein